MRVRAFAEDFGLDLFVASLFLLLFVLALMACGDDKKPETYGPPPVVVSDPAWDNEIKALVQNKCGPCHNGTIQPLKFDSAAKFRASKAKIRISNASMPPNGPLDETSKQKLLAYLGA